MSDLFFSYDFTGRETVHKLYSYVAAQCPFKVIFISDTVYQRILLYNNLVTVPGKLTKLLYSKMLGNHKS